MKSVLVFCSLFLFVLSACGESTHIHHTQAPVVIDPVEPSGTVSNQLLLEFAASVDLQQAMREASACAQSVRRIRSKPVLLLLVLPKSSDHALQAKSCIQLPGVIRAEWNQKRLLR